jgi:hypothetical protein
MKKKYINYSVYSVCPVKFGGARLARGGYILHHEIIGGAYDEEPIIYIAFNDIRIGLPIK